MSWGFDVDLGFVTDTAGQLGEAVTLAREMRQRADALEGQVAAAGSPAVQQAATTFLQRWGYGVRLIDDDTSWAADGLRACAEVYADVEQGVVTSMDTVAAAVSDGAEAAGEAVSDGAKAVGDAVGDTVRGGVDAIGDVLG
ncbi:MAG: hypothetical protein GEV03_16965 [Streptosporangiales bacterium]|nr:hypothetical protein [Streptosporangiales bacterium]